MSEHLRVTVAVEVESIVLVLRLTKIKDSHIFYLLVISNKLIDHLQEAMVVVME